LLVKIGNLVFLEHMPATLLAIKVAKNFKTQNIPLLLASVGNVDSNSSL